MAEAEAVTPTVESTSTSKRVGRPPKYDWTGKKDLLYRLYVTEQKSASDIAKYFAETFELDPSDIPCKRGFLRQFSLWGFPTHGKKLSADDEAVISARMHELWEKNTCQKDIKSTLANEGWDLKHHEFHKIWKANGLRLRNDRGYKVPTSEKPKKRKRRNAAGEDALPDLHAQLEAAAAAEPEPEPEQDQEDDIPLDLPLEPEELAQRQQRLFELQLESDQRMLTKKRRRRIRGYAHLPADAPGLAPRYNSETSLDESKAYLHLSNHLYQTIRNEYQAICEEMGIIKKTECAEGVWEESKHRLIRENAHLLSMTHPIQPDQDRKAVALECICSDVTKRMRVANRHMSIAQANNVLGINPAHSKTVRRTFYEMLAAAKFESRFVDGEDEWKTLKQRWYEAHEELQAAINEGDPQKTRAIDLLAGDAMKRFREDRRKSGFREPFQKNTRYGPGPGPAWAGSTPRTKVRVEPRAAPVSPHGAQISRSQAREAVHGGTCPDQPNGNFIGTLAQSTSEINFDLDPALARPFLRAPPEPEVLEPPIPCYFRLATNSTLVGHHPKMWIGKLTSKSIGALHKVATSKAGAAKVTQVKGIVKNDDGTEDNWQIDDEDELQAYLDSAGPKPTFIVLMEGGYV